MPATPIRPDRIQEPESPSSRQDLAPPGQLPPRKPVSSEKLDDHLRVYMQHFGRFP